MSLYKKFNKNKYLRLFLGGIVLLLGAAAPLAWAAPAGTIIFAVGDAQVISANAAPRAAEKNLVVNEGDKIGRAHV